MSFPVDYSEQNEAGDYSPAPAGIYKLRVEKIEEKESKSGWPQVEVEIIILEPTRYAGKRLRHYVTFIKAGEKGAGFAKKWLKSIGQPHGKAEVDPPKWINTPFFGELTVEKFMGRDNQTVRKNSLNVARTWAADDASAPPVGEHAGQPDPAPSGGHAGVKSTQAGDGQAGQEDLEEVPF